MKKNIKTNAMRELDKAMIAYETLYYDLGDAAFSAEAVSEKLGIDPFECYKTLALKHDRDLFVIVIGAKRTIDLKKAAKALKVKDLKMIAVKDLLKEVGYERGSVSPLGIHRKHHTVFDAAAENAEKLVISGGMKGISLRIGREELFNYLQVEILDVCED